MVISKTICVIDGLGSHEDHCMPMGPTVFKLDSQIPSAIVRSRAAAPTFSNIGLGVRVRLCGVFSASWAKLPHPPPSIFCQETWLQAVVIGTNKLE